MSTEPGGTWTVQGTKGGSLPVQVEKRPMGKKVTIISGVNNAEILSKELKVALGTGSTCRPGEVQLQGDHAERVTAFLMAAPVHHLLGISGRGKAATAKKDKAELVTRKEEEDAQAKEKEA
eukprot:CAMPEP_0180391042 /NCGR_PEP_ID=MMETSP0989-20121125/32358_1 /TAXON_ID=697907 /ORGANISM="non described non described, Strain CCMP2293" /LENGTH=120 /DNA_ID=CAMNT_0022392539 /DNA_START=32 /DNA_END=390 /DNA_ORIENTATION=+